MTQRKTTRLRAGFR